MYIFDHDITELHDWIRREVQLENALSEGSSGMATKRVQEWLNLRGFGVAIDSQYGPITADAVSRFQQSVGFLNTNGITDEDTFNELVRPMRDLLRQRLDMSVSIEQAVITYASAHLEKHPREMGGQNRGPWVRLYMKGNEGTPWAWCAGFVTFILHQATDSLSVPMPIRGSNSCDSLAAQAQTAGLFLSENAAKDTVIPAGSIFLIRRTSTDWTHTGFATEIGSFAFRTIEGNTNDDGSREGYEVCTRSRGYSSKDFILYQ